MRLENLIRDIDSAVLSRIMENRTMQQEEAEETAAKVGPVSYTHLPSSDLFFDLANKSYNTFIHAFPYDTFTGYPLSTESEDQLLLLLDAYLSCMTAPGILTDENIFRREALRYELYSPEDPISMTGTVYSEDFGSLTDVNSCLLYTSSRRPPEPAGAFRSRSGKGDPAAALPRSCARLPP